MLNPVLVPIGIDRGRPRRFRIAIVGIDLTGATFHAQVRLPGDLTSGTPVVNLPTVTDATTLGVRMAGTATVDGAITSYVDVQFTALPDGTSANQWPVGSVDVPDVALAWDFFVTRTGHTVEKWAYGPLIVHATVTKEGSPESLVADPLPGEVGTVLAFDGADQTIVISDAGLLGSFATAAAASAATALAARDSALGAVAAIPLVKKVTGTTAEAWTDPSGYNWALLTPTEFRHKAVQANQRAAAKALLGPPDPTLADMRAVSERIGVHGTGESLSVGSSGLPLLSSVASTYSDMFNGGIRPDNAANITGASDPNLTAHRASLTAAYEQHSSASFTAGDETPMSGIAQMIVQLLRDEDGIDIATSGMKFLLTADGRVGSGIGAEVNGAGTWTAERFNASITQAASLYNTAGKAYFPAANTLLIGTNDNYNDAANYPTPTAKYFYNIAVTLQAQRQALARAAVGGTRRLPMLIGQTATHVQVPIARPNVALDQVQLAIDKQEFILAVVQYAILYPNVDVHPGSYGYKHAGAYLGLALKRLLFDGFRVAPLIPTFKAQGSKIIATFPVNPGRKIVQATPPSGSVLSNWGVTATTAGGTAKALSNPRIVGRDTVVWDAPSVPADTWKFQCGFTGNSTIGFTNIAEQLNDGPIIFDPDYLRLPMYRWLPIYEGTLS